MRNALLISLCFIAGLAGSNVQPILTGAGSLIFPEASPSASISAASGALSVAAGGSGKNVILKPTGSGCVQLFADSPAITLCDSSGQITVASGGTNQNINLTPSGTGAVHLVGTNFPELLLDNGAGIGQKNIAGTSRNLLSHYSDDNVYLDNADGPIHLRPNGGSYTFNTSSFTNTGGTGSYAVDITGDINASGVFRKGGTAGVGIGSTITVCTSGACATSCSLIFSGGIRTGGTCP
jgi:hypothetical protein